MLVLDAQSERPGSIVENAEKPKSGLLLPYSFDPLADVYDFVIANENVFLFVPNLIGELATLTLP